MSKLRDLFSNKWLRFSVVTIVYVLLFLVWARMWGMIIGVLVIYDLYISKFYYRLFWRRHLELKKKRMAYKSIMGWVEAIVFAVVVASLIRIYFVEMYVIPSPSMEKTLLVGDYIGVSKISYGPKLPNTPLAIPLVHNINPLSPTSKSYVEWIKRSYRRLPGLDTLKHNDVVVFNYPEGDTVLVASPQDNYYSLVDAYGVEAVRQASDIMVHPVDKRDNYIKRAIGLPGDVLEIINGEVFINNEPQVEDISGRQLRYAVRHEAESLSSYALSKLGINTDNIRSQKPHVTEILLTGDEVKALENSKGIIEVLRLLTPKTAGSLRANTELFPRSKDYSWTDDDFGPLWIPRKGSSIDLTLENLPLYKRIIDVYEDNELEVRDGAIFINGARAYSYTFKMNYFFMMGDNRYNSLDSRYFGFVPEDHIVGKASFIWFSKGASDGVRFNRIFNRIK